MIPILFFALLFLHLRLFGATKGVDPTCQAAQSSGSWRSFSSVWSPHGCYLHSYHADLYDFDRCFADHRHDIHYVFAGDSTARQVFWGMVGLVDGKMGTQNYSSYTSLRHSNFHLSFPRYPTSSGFQNRQSSIYLSFYWDPFFNSSALYELGKYHTEKDSPLATAYTSIGLWFSRHYLEEEIYEKFAAAINRVSYTLKSLYSTLPARKGTRKDDHTTYGNSRAHSLFLAPILHPYTPRLTPDRARDMTHEKVRLMNRVINQVKSASGPDDEMLNDADFQKAEDKYDLANIGIPSVFNTFTKGYPDGYDSQGIHFNDDLSGIQALLLTNLRCNSALSHSPYQVPPHYSQNTPLKSAFDYPNYQACCAGPSPKNESIALWFLVISLLTLLLFTEKKKETRLSKPLSFRSIFSKAIQSLLWISIFMTIKTGITGIKRELANGSDVFLIIVVLLSILPLARSMIPNVRVASYSQFRPLDKIFYSLKGFSFLIYVFVFGLLPDLRSSSTYGSWGVTFYWILANFLATLFIYDACQVGKSASYITTSYLKNSAELLDSGFEDCETGTSEETSAHLAIFNLTASSVIGFESFATQFFGSSLMVWRFLAVFKALFYVFLHTCGPIILISTINLIPNLSFVKKSLSLSSEKVPLLMYPSEYHWALSLFFLGTVSWLFSVSMHLFDNSKEFRHPHEVAQGASSVGVKFQSYFKSTAVYGVFLLLTLYFADFTVSKLTFPQNVKHIEFFGIQIFTFFAYQLVQFYYSCIKLRQQKIRMFAKVYTISIGLFLTLLFGFVYTSHMLPFKNPFKSAENDEEEQPLESVSIVNLKLTQLLLSMLFAGLIVIICTNTETDKSQSKGSMTSKNDPETLFSSASGLGGSESQIHSRNYSNSYVAVQENGSFDYNHFDYNYQPADASYSFASDYKFLKKRPLALKIYKLLCSHISALLLIVGRYSFELLLLIVLVFNVPIFQDMTASAALHLSDISYFYWTLPRVFATHGSSLLSQALDLGLVVAMLVVAAKNVAEIFGR